MEIKELYKKKVASGGSYSAKFYAASTIFFLSAGYLGSQLQSRAYDSVDVATGRKELRIQGTGAWRPNIALLLNVKLPVPGLNEDKFAFAVSAGPVYRATGGQSGNTAANVGVFAGVSGHIRGKLTITPGFHIGEFADMPLGFDNNHDRTIPAGIQNPITGVNRWTARFGVAITWGLADFKKGASAATLKESAPSGAGGASGATDKAAAEKAVMDAQTAVDSAKTALDKANADFTKKDGTRKNAEEAFEKAVDEAQKTKLKAAAEDANKQADAAAIAKTKAQAALDEANKKLEAAKAALDKVK